LVGDSGGPIVNADGEQVVSWGIASDANFLVCSFPRPVPSSGSANHALSAPAVLLPTAWLWQWLDWWRLADW
jgi:hypothetical protein